MGYTNSSMVVYKKLSPNHSGQRTHSIDRITPHCVVGQCSVETLGDIFYPSSRQASCQYGIGADGRVGMYVEEKNRSWCSSSNANDQRAVTIECASDTAEPYAFRDIVYQTLIKLCVDICKRNGKKKLLWLGSKEKTLAYEPASDEMVLTVHRWFANKSCPGNWMYARMGDLAAKVTGQLGGSSAATGANSATAKNTKFPAVPFTVNVIINDLNYRSAGSMSAKVLGQTGKGVFTITQVKDGWGKLKSGAGWIYLENPSYCTIGKAVSSEKKVSLQEGESKEEVKGETKAEGKTGEEVIWDTLYAAIGNAYGTAGLMGNLYAESALKANNLQNNGNTKLGMTDAEFTAAFDGGKYAEDTFIHDGYGYGLAQWTYYSRKEALLKYAKSKGKSIGDLSMQLAFLISEIKGYTAVWNTLTSAKTVKEASDKVLTGYERPADQSDAVKVKRAGYGQTYYDRYASKSSAAGQKTEDKKQDNKQVATTLDAKYAKYINSTGTHYISNSGHDENNKYSGGQAGDQTGTEWQMRSWYNRPWTCVLRYPDQKVGLKLAQLAIDAALNDKIGYDQSQNRTYLAQLKAGGWDPAKITVACEADCSAGVCANVTAAGYLLGIRALQTHTGTYTGNMRSALTKAGFTLLTDSKYLTSGDYLLPGDILLNDGAHTATNVTVGAKVKASWKPGTAAASTGSTVKTIYYRVRKSWSDKASQIGAYTVLENAKLCVDQNPGYAVFDEGGKQLYPAKAASVPYLVRVSIKDLNYRKGPSTSYASWGYIAPGIYTIVEEQDGWGLLKAYQDKRNGWISLQYASEV